MLLRRSLISLMSWSDIDRMSRFRGNQRLARRLVFSTVPFCQGEDGSQNHVWVPISACRCGQLTNSVPRSNVMDLRAIWGRSLMALMILPPLGDISIACRAMHDRFCTFVRVLQYHCKPAHAFNQSRYVGLPKLLFKQH